jgi:hypothetical protein
MTRRARLINYEELAGRALGDLIEQKVLVEPSGAYGQTLGGTRTDE